MNNVVLQQVDDQPLGKHFISATNGNKRRNLMLNKILYNRSLPSITYSTDQVHKINRF